MDELIQCNMHNIKLVTPLKTSEWKNWVDFLALLWSSEGFINADQYFRIQISLLHYTNK
jgi:hypothetical protein